MFSIVIVSIYIPANSARGFPFFTSSPAFTVCRFFNDGHSNQCEVIPHCSFDLHFSNKTCVFVCVCVWVAQLCLTLVTQWTIACQVPLSMGLSSQEHWSGSHSILYGDIPDPGIELGLPHCEEVLYHQRCQEIPIIHSVQFRSVSQSCPTLHNPMDCSMPSLPPSPTPGV